MVFILTSGLFAGQSEWEDVMLLCIICHYNVNFAPFLSLSLCSIRGAWAVNLFLWELQFIIAGCSLNPLLIHCCVSEGVATCWKCPPTEEWTKVTHLCLMAHCRLAVIVKHFLVDAKGAGNQKIRNPNHFNFPPRFLKEKHRSSRISSQSSLRRKWSGSYVNMEIPGTFRMAK